MKYSSDKIILRPLEYDDIRDRIYWETEETEWQLWDGPWDYEGKSEKERMPWLLRFKRRNID